MRKKDDCRGKYKKEKFKEWKQKEERKPQETGVDGEKRKTGHMGRKKGTVMKKIDRGKTNPYE